MKLKKDEIVEILWADITTEDNWMEEKKASKFLPYICKSVGYFLNEDEDLIRISDTIGVTDTERSINVIPRGCIKSISKLKR